MLSLNGQVLDGKYRIERQLGAGGMGAVFLATHLGTTRPVALKVIAPQFMANAEFVERFKREAEAAGRLRHPNVVNVTDFGFARQDTGPLAYLVMEYLDGATLGDLLRQQPQLPLAFVVDVVEQVCLAIDKAHKQGIIHRDLKPDNIWLEPNGRGGHNVKVLDFGLAKLRQVAPAQTAHGALADAAARPLAAAQHDAPTAAGAAETVRLYDDAAETMWQRDDAASSAPTLIDTDAGAADAQSARAGQETEEVRGAETNPAGQLTQAGVILGTPHYMSPEQCRGEPLSASSDLYSLGIITYQMLAGAPPFAGTTSAALLVQHRQAPPPPLTEKRRDVPQPVAAVVMSALAKDPAARPSDAIAFATSLRTNAAGESALIRQALTLYGEHFSTFLMLSLCGLTPATVGVSTLFIWPLMPPLHTPFVIASITITFMLGLLVFNALVGGIVVPFVAQLQVAPLRPLRLKPIFGALKPRLKAYLIASLMAHTSFITFIVPIMLYAFCPASIRTQLTGSLLFWTVVPCWLLAGALLLKRDQRAGKWLYAPVVLVEGLEGRRALARSKVLVERLAGTLGNLFPLFTLTTMTATVLATMISWLLLKQLAGGPGLREAITLLIVVALGILLGALLSILLNPLIAIEMSLFYLKARQTGGEAFEPAAD